MSEVVRYEVEQQVAVVTIDRPEKRNAMSADVFDQLTKAALRAGADEAVGAVVVRGEGGTFSSGIDVNVFGGQIGGGGRIDDGFIRPLQAAFDAFEDIDKPTVAAIEGACFGAGLQLALGCHLRAVAPSASLSVLEARWGLIPDLGGSFRLPRLVGLGRATELAVTARKVDADEALRIGLAEIPLGGGDPLKEAVEFAAALARGPGAIRRVARLMRENLGRGREEASAAERAAQIACIDGPDFTEAVTARMGGREPRFVGR